MSDRAIYFRKKYISTLMFTISIIFLVCLYLTIFIQMREEHENGSEKPDELDSISDYDYFVWYTFLGGLNYQDDKRHYNFAYQSLGYTIMIILMVIERKSEVWISSRFGCEGNTLEHLKEMEENQKDKDSIWNNEEKRKELVDSI